MTAVEARTAIDAARDVVAALGRGVRAAYVVGSAASGGFEPGESDLDLLVVWDRPLARREKDELVARARRVDVAPARGLELVVYAGGERALNLNTGPGLTEHVGYEPEDDPPFWFVLDRAVAEQHALPLSGPPWRDSFQPVPRGEVLDALEQMLRWHELEAPRSAAAALNAVRAWRYAATGSWITKPAAAAWLLEQARAALREAG